MNVVPNHHRSSLRTFFGYLTLACISLAVGRSVERCTRTGPLLGLFLTLTVFAATGAALGALFGRPGRGAVLGIAAACLLTCLFAMAVVMTSG